LWPLEYDPWLELFAAAEDGAATRSTHVARNAYLDLLWDELSNGDRAELNLLGFAQQTWDTGDWRGIISNFHDPELKQIIAKFGFTDDQKFLVWHPSNGVSEPLAFCNAM
jgi:hypothetical protein